MADEIEADLSMLPILKPWVFKSGLIDRANLAGLTDQQQDEVILAAMDVPKLKAVVRHVQERASQGDEDARRTVLELTGISIGRGVKAETADRPLTLLESPLMQTAIRQIAAERPWVADSLSDPQKFMGWSLDIMARWCMLGGGTPMAFAKIPDAELKQAMLAICPGGAGVPTDGERSLPV